MKTDSTTPEWPQLNPEDHKIVPIMEQTKPDTPIKEELRRKHRE